MRDFSLLADLGRKTITAFVKNKLPEKLSREVRCARPPGGVLLT